MEFSTSQTGKFTRAISVIIPAYNEGGHVRSMILRLRQALSERGLIYEIIVVNDGSTDKSSHELQNTQGITLLAHPYNKGYGASLKTGAKQARYDWLLCYDADGQHEPQSALDLIEHVTNYDMIIGSRIGYQGPALRQPGKYVLKKIACYAVGFKIPDLNSGLRLVRTELFHRYEHLYPQGFSLSTTITLAFIKYEHTVKFVPISIKKREGKSTVKPKDALHTLKLIFRIIMIFSPLRFFMPLTLFLLVFGIISLGIDVHRENLTDMTILLFLSSLIIGSLSLIADQIASIRREMF